MFKVFVLYKPKDQVQSFMSALREIHVKPPKLK